MIIGILEYILYNTNSFGNYFHEKFEKIVRKINYLFEEANIELQ